MSKAYSLEGTRSGRIVALYDTGERKHGNCIWRCRCDCGEECDVYARALKKGLTKSCGCLQREGASESCKKTGEGNKKQVGGVASKQHPLYTTWRQMKHRCYGENCADFPYYGGRGIAVCKRWRESFEAFVTDMGERPEGHTLDRKDNDGHYEPDNCRWSTALEQTHNRRNSLHA